MSLRPEPARWFEALVARDDLPTALEALAATGAVELEVHGETAPPFRFEDLQPQLDAYHELAEAYGRYWPRPDRQGRRLAASPTRTLEQALDRLRAWRAQAEPHVRRLEALGAERADLVVLSRMLAADEAPELELQHLRGTGSLLAAAIYVLAADTRVQGLPPRVITRPVTLDTLRCVLVLAPRVDMRAVDEAFAAARGRRLTVPDWLHGTPRQARSQVAARIREVDDAVARHRESLRRLGQKYGLATVLGELERLDWFLAQVRRLPLTEYLSWVTGWTSDPDGRHLQHALGVSGARALVHLTDPPPELEPPLVLRNPGWARAFELFTRLLGTPARTEADPSTLVAIVAPVMFGYMFGDIGQGAVLLGIGLALHRRFPILRMLVSGGALAMVFGLLFGSVFSMEHLVPALWLHPIDSPLPVLAIPLVGGGVLLVVGQLLGAAGAAWRRGFNRWLRTDAALLVLYVSLWLAVILPGALIAAALAAAWFVVGYAARGRHRHPATGLAAGVGELLENTLRLAVNTLSFVRIGAFALAHAGLALAVVSLAAIPEHNLIAGLILVLGNALIIALEGLVVSVQTTRLVLFEFFVRFLHAGGRGFRPLAAPLAPTASPRRTS